ncbi:MAG: IS630 family transposase, partial [Culicoidibacterales bacterium]
NKPPILTAEQKTQIKKWIDDDCSLSLKKISDMANEEFGRRVSKNTIDRAISGFCYSLKRIHCVPIRRNIQDTLEERRKYALDYISLQSQYSESQFIFVDETGFNISMRSTRGRSLLGTPATQIVPQIRSRNISICCAMSVSGIIHYRSQNRAYNAEFFTLFIRELATKLNTPAVLIMDNVKFHKVASVIEEINSNGFAVKYLPPYSPFLNPIENMFSQWK